MKLYYSPGACSMAPHIVLRETGAKFDAIKVDLAAKKTANGDDYWPVNAKGAVPALQLADGSVLTECSAVMQYIGDHAEGSDIMPKAGTMERYREVEWLNWIASEFHKSMGSLWNKEMADKAGDVIKANIDKKAAHLDKHLAKNEYLVGGHFTAADAYAFTILNWAGMVGVDISAYKNIAAFMGRVAQRPAVQATLKAEGLIS
jgi:glutathione S-transferase